MYQEILSLPDPHTQVTISCFNHGPFTQTPNEHLVGSGCAKPGFSPNKSGLFYYIAISTDDGGIFYKIGITNFTIEERFPAADLMRIRVVKIWRFAVGLAAAEREAEILYQFSESRYYGPDILVGGGNTELFIHSVLALDKGEGESGQAVVDAHGSLC